MNVELGPKARLGIAIASLWVLCVACDGDSPSFPNIAENGAQTTVVAADTDMQNEDKASSKTPLTLPPMPNSRYQGRRNPFSPLITLEKEHALIAPAAQPVKREPQTTLERIALNQLTLTAIFKGPQGNKAIVEEEGGKGYIVEKGAFVGTQGGRIQSIIDGRVIIVGKTVDTDGKVTTWKRELKLASRANDPS